MRVVYCILYLVNKKILMFVYFIWVFSSFKKIELMMSLGRLNTFWFKIVLCDWASLEVSMKWSWLDSRCASRIHL